MIKKMDVMTRDPHESYDIGNAKYLVAFKCANGKGRTYVDDNGEVKNTEEYSKVYECETKESQEIIKNILIDIANIANA